MKRRNRLIITLIPSRQPRPPKLTQHHEHLQWPGAAERAVRHVDEVAIHEGAVRGRAVCGCDAGYGQGPGGAGEVDGGFLDDCEDGEEGFEVCLFGGEGCWGG